MAVSLAMRACAGAARLRRLRAAGVVGIMNMCGILLFMINIT